MATQSTDNVPEFDVFVSHSNDDQQYIITLVKGLEAAGIRCWYAPRNIIPGDVWAESISLSIRKTEVLLIVLTKHANDSQQVLYEVQLADRHKKKIVCLKAEDVELSAGLDYLLSSRHYIRVVGKSFGKVLPELLETIKMLLPSNSLSTSSTEYKSVSDGKVYIGDTEDDKDFRIIVKFVTALLLLVTLTIGILNYTKVSKKRENDTIVQDQVRTTLKNDSIKRQLEISKERPANQGDNDRPVQDHTAGDESGNYTSNDPVLTAVEQQPQFPGGISALKDYLDAAIENYYDNPDQLVGRVYVAFVVNIDGSIQEVEVVKGMGVAIDTGVRKIVGNMPKWIPGKQSGRGVRVKYNMVITFPKSERP